MRNLKILALIVAAIFLAAWSNDRGSGSVNNSTSTTMLPANVAGVNIGNVATIPLGYGSGSTSAIVSNNYTSQLVLTEANYIIYGPSGASAPHDATKFPSLVNVSLCQTIQAKGTCTLILKAPTNVTQGQYLVTLKFLNPSNQHTYSTSQLISYSKVVSTTANDQIRISPINNTLYNIPNGLTTYSVPFVLNKAVTNLIATSQNNNPAFKPVISCEGVAPYPAGTTCTLMVYVSQTGNAQLISGNITVRSTDMASSSSQAKSKVTPTQATSSYLFNVPVTVIQNNTGNLVTSAVNVIVSPANGESPQTITLFNNGTSTIKITGIQATGATVIGTPSCGSKIVPGAACGVSVNSTLSQNAQASVIMNYSSGETSNSLAFNIIYILPNSTAGLSMTPTTTNLSNTVVGSTNSTSINIRNTGQSTLTNIDFTSMLPAGFSYSTDSSCNTNGTQSLAAGQSCTLVLNYSPTTTDSGSLIIRGAGNYTYGGLSGSIESVTATVSYSSIAGSAFVYITPSYVAYAIHADNKDSVAQTFAIVNAGPVATTVTAESLASMPITAYAYEGGSCIFPQTLGAAGSSTESCTVIAQFGPTLTTMSNLISHMTVTYSTFGSNIANAFAKLSFSSSTAALVSISSMVERGATSGNGRTPTNAYKFTNSPQNNPGIVFTITYKNTGSESAVNFSAALNTLPVGYYPLGGTCNAGAQGSSTLAASGGTCTAIFAVESTALYNSYSLNGDLSFNMPGWSYNDSTGLHANSAPTYGGYTDGKIYVTSNVLSTATQTPATNFTGASAGSAGVNNLNFAGTPDGTVITILHTNFLVGITFGNSGTCTITSGSCQIAVGNFPGLAVTTYYFMYMVSPNGSSSSQGIIKYGSFTYIN